MYKNFSIRKADGSERPFSSYEVSMPQSGAKIYQSTTVRGQKLPSRVDLRSEMSDIESQEQTNSCTANAVAGAVEYLFRQQLGDDAYELSRLFIYYNARALNPYNKGIIKDTGSAILYCIKGIKDYGVCSEDTWEFDTRSVNTQPSPEAYQEAEAFQIEGEETLPTDLNAWKSALAEGYPIIFAVKTYKTFDTHRKPGLIPLPSNNEANRKDHGLHAMLCVGYSDKDKVFIVRNSWGNKWGDGGYCYMPYDYILSKDHNLGYNAIIKHAEALDIHEETWFDDDESVLGDYETELANMSDEDYEAMLEDMGDYPLEYRITIIFIHVANADDDFSRAERKELLNYLQNTFETLGSEYDAKDVLNYTWRNDSDDDDLLVESVELLGQYLSSEMLATIVNDLRGIISIDDESEEETDYIDYLVAEWQLEYEEDSDEEEDDDDEDYDDEDEDEYDEEDEDEYNDEDEDDEEEDYDDEDEEDEDDDYDEDDDNEYEDEDDEEDE